MPSEINFSAFAYFTGLIEWVMTNNLFGLVTKHNRKTIPDVVHHIWHGLFAGECDGVCQERQDLRFYTNKLITGRHFLALDTKKTTRTRRKQFTHPRHNNFSWFLDFQPIPDGTSYVSYLPAIRITGTIVHIILATDWHIRTSPNWECRVLSISRAIGYRIRRCWWTR